ncbi:hypothetical protein [Hymenobacter gelipurpurascens]|uniref:hypothetical protein n=1 Tax=Hymenobacter gelipurpurascens TaxID=89968 RepID=UPI000B5897ED|nr:hypothetical protein [Hymenobacter gelipurpurascens]
MRTNWQPSALPPTIELETRVVLKKLPAAHLALAELKGLVAAHSAVSLLEQLVTEQLYVWPDAESDQWGCAIEPLYPRLAQAAKADAHLYELLALVDALRLGRPRERKLAGDLFKVFMLPAHV